MSQYTNEVRARDKLLRWYGPDRVEQVEPLSTDCFMARLVGGEIAVATVAEDGTISIREPEAVC